LPFLLKSFNKNAVRIFERGFFDPIQLWNKENMTNDNLSTTTPFPSLMRPIPDEASFDEFEMDFVEGEQSRQPILGAALVVQRRSTDY